MWNCGDVSMTASSSKRSSYSMLTVMGNNERRKARYSLFALRVATEAGDYEQYSGNLVGAL